MSVQRNTVQESLGMRNSGPVLVVVPLLEVASEWNSTSDQSRVGGFTLSIPFKITSWDSHSASLAVTSCFSDDTFSTPHDSAPHLQAFSISLD